MALGRTKVTVIGAGNVGGTVAFHVAQQGYADVVLLDRPDDLTLEKPLKTGSMAFGKALDLNQVSPIVGYDSRVTGTWDYADTAGSDIVVITSGLPRKPNQKREELIADNEPIVRSVAKKAVEVSPNAIFIVVTNPLDAMCHVALNATGRPASCVIGQAGILDSTRYRNAIASALHISVEDVQAYVLGGHGDQMVPIRSMTTVGGIPIQNWVDSGKLSADQLLTIEQETRDGGATLTRLIGTSAWFAPGVAAAEMVEAIALDRKRILPCTVLLDGHYHIPNKLYFGVPVLLGKSGVEEIYDLTELMSLTPGELNGIQESAKKVQETVDILKKLDSESKLSAVD
jgi:malate dehydrogenase